ncbi:MAG: protein kinase [Bryobacteraceae bacterium]
MPSTPGSRLGPYRIIAPLGVGGMGEVYRAHDTRLKRDVAIKILPPSFSSNPESMARFQREAETLASLNHPNIAQIYGVEEQALVMELVEGDSPQGPLPFDQAWNIASQIAAGLEYAHDKGIVHRDLKPANVKVTPDGVVKLLDFGLAKAFTDQPATPPKPVDAQAVTVRATQAGVILGTPDYMAPEQAQGKPVDKRADIWAFGVVLYELLTGERLFAAEGLADTLAQVLTKPIDFLRIPAQARPLLQECLQRDHKQRLRDIGDARRLITHSLPPTPAPPRTQWLPWAVAGSIALIAAVLGFTKWPAAPVPGPTLMRLSVDLGPNATADSEITAILYPDGTLLAHLAKQSSDRPAGLAVRQLDQATGVSTVLSGTEDAWLPFFSPDGRWIAHFENQRKLKKISVKGGAPISLFDAPNAFGGSWADDDTIIYSANGKLFRGPAAGGTPHQLPARGEDLRWPHVLPGAHAVLFSSFEKTTGLANIEALNLDTGAQKELTRGHSSRYVPSPDGRGYLLFLRDGVLFAVAFNARKLETLGTPEPLAQDIAPSYFGGGQYDVSRSGNLLYLSGSSARTDYSISWMDATGKQTPLLSKPGGYRSPRLSPDGKRVAYMAPGSKGLDLWIYDIDRDTTSQLTFTGPGDQEPVWAPDAKHIVFGSASPPALWWMRADGSGQPQKLIDTQAPPRPQSISADGRRLAYADNIYPDIYTLPLDLADPEHPKPGKPEPFLVTAAVEVDAAFSPDGRWLAFASNESGREEVFVRQFPDGGGKWKISTDDGWAKFPRWSRTSRELFFLGSDDRIMVAPYTVEGNSFVAGKPRVWADPKILRTDVHPNFDLAPNGKQVLVLPVSAGGPNKPNIHVTFLLNLASELHRRTPQ